MTGTDPPPDGGEGDGEEVLPALATDPVLTNAVDVPELGHPVDTSAAEAVSSAHEAAKSSS